MREVPHHPVRILALNHFFDQDLQALEAHPDVELRRVPYTRFRDRATAILGSEVGVGLDRFNARELESERGRYAAWLRDEFELLYTEWPFEVVVLPSDVFFYVRALPNAVHRLGVPVAVVQKETTISPATMREHAPVIGEQAPFISDLMTVCSERQKRFWLRTGADPTAIRVTGQPRFDLYASARERWEPGDPRRVVFLSFELDAYEPGAGRGRGRHTWSELRSEIEEALLELVSSGAADVTVKHHPQQQMADETRRLRRLAGRHWERRFRIAPPLGDTRRVLTSADVVVGFQTTALFEAVAAGRPTIFAAWGDSYERYREDLIRFDRSGGCVEHARSPRELKRMVCEAEPPATSCADWYESVLGPVDGRATDRVVASLDELVSACFPTSLADRLRKPSQRRRAAVKALPQVALREAGLRMARSGARAVGRGRGVRIRLDAAVERRRRLWQVVRDPYA